MSTAPRAPLMSLDDALQALLAHITPLSTVESVATLDADGRILAQDLVSALQVPAFDNSSMDGYAVRSADVQRLGSELTVTQRIAAGHIAGNEHIGAQPAAADPVFDNLGR